MRIISGLKKGKRFLPPNNLPVRPTTDRAKEGLFNILENRYFFENKNCLDLFSGTGNIAYEFASRGCQEVLAIDKNQKCISYIERNSKELDIKIDVVKSECLSYLNSCNKKFNFIFADPPYNYQLYKELVNIIYERKIIKKDGCLILEHNKDIQFNESTEIRKYGGVYFSIFTF